MNVLSILVHRLTEMATGFVAILPQLIIAAMVLLVTWFAAQYARQIADRLLKHTHFRGSLIELTETLIGVAIWIAGLMVASAVVLPGVTPANLLTVVGLGSVAVGFAFKDIFENFLAGILIMMRTKMRMGDLIECEKVTGKVEHITLRETHLRLPSSELVLVPNSFLFRNPVKILTDSPRRRHEVEVSVGYGADLDEAARVIEAAVRAGGGADADRQVDVFAKAFGDSGILFLVRWWAGSQPIDMHRSRDAAVRAIRRALAEAGMDIPYPHRTLNFREPLPLTRVPRRPNTTTARSPSPPIRSDEDGF